MTSMNRRARRVGGLVGLGSLIVAVRRGRGPLPPVVRLVARAAYAITGAFVWHFGVRVAEERDLLDRFGGEYAAYRAAVPLWRARLRGYDTFTR